MGEAFQQAAYSDAEVIFVADLNLNPRLINKGGENFGIIKKLAKDRKVTWFDHHTGTLEHKSRLEKLGIHVHYSRNQCASLIIAESLQLQDSYELKLAQIAQASDFKDTSKDPENASLAEKLEKIISLANESLDESLLQELTTDLMEGLVFDNKWKLLPFWWSYLNQYNQRENEAYRELDESVSIIHSGGYKVLFGYSSPLLSRQGIQYLRRNYGEKADIFICLSKAPLRNHLIITHDGSSFSAVSFAQSLGGGGRGNGGGFTLDDDITSENYEMVKGMLVEELAKYCY